LGYRNHVEIANQVKRKIVVIAPLDWGLGHLTRTIALANLLTNFGYEVCFAIPSHYQKYLKEFPYQTITIAGYNVKYYKHCHPIFSLILQIPKFVFTMYREWMAAKKITHKIKPDLIISDNRPFFRTKGIPSYYISHQLQLPLAKPFDKVVHLFYHYLINRFDHCLVPDFPDRRLSGKLSNPQNLKIPVHFCGLLSRFQSITLKESKIEYKILFIASGPQPERNVNIDLISNIFSALPYRCAIVGCSKPTQQIHKTPNVDIFNHLPIDLFAELAQKSEILLSKSGYTTIMDAIALNKPLIMWPTLGQWEQEYLARHLKDFPGIYVLQDPKELLGFDFTNIQKPINKTTNNSDEILKNIFL